MEVVTFVENEKVSLISDPDEWKSKVEELGLKGQKELFEGGTKANPFLRMDEGLKRVFQSLCPETCDIADFRVEPIPIQALAMYGLAKHEGYFTSVEIWYSPGQPDPVMVGKAGNREFFLMAQWGPEHFTLDECRRRAAIKWKERTKARLQKVVSESSEKLRNLDALAVEYFNGDWVYIPS